VPTASSWGHGPLSDFLTPGSGLVTVSSTAALESIDRGIPTLLISDFGFDAGLLNEAFADSGATGTLAEVAAGAIGFPGPEWLAANYFHPEDGQLRRSLGLLATRARTEQLPNRRLRRAPAEACAAARRAAHFHSRTYRQRLPEAALSELKQVAKPLAARNGLRDNGGGRVGIRRPVTATQRPRLSRGRRGPGWVPAGERRPRCRETRP
jgi:hypothetical protein